MAPRIGVNMNVRPGLRRQGDGRLLTLSPDYPEAIAAAGGRTVLLPPRAPDGAADDGAVRELVADVDALLLTGGDDLDPRAYGQEPHPRTRLIDPQREAFDRALVRHALAADIPLLAICAGMQLVNVALGGTLHQHLADAGPSCYPALHPLHQDHEGLAGEHGVSVAAASRLAAVIGAAPLATNSRHHQAVDRLGAGLAVAARAEDGVVEAIEAGSGRFLLGVQWHPEEVPGNQRQILLFRALVQAALDRTGGSRLR